MVFEKVRDIIAKGLNVDPAKITMETHLIDDLGADSLDAVELIMALEDEFGLEVDDDAAQNAKTVAELKEMAKKKRERDRIYSILKATTEFYHNNLINNQNSLQAQYLKKRGINEDMINKFKIGASLNYNDLITHLKDCLLRDEVSF